MSQLPYDTKMLRRYLLGTASSAESERLDELSLSDDDCALALAAAENDLVDGYARANLDAEERDQFAQHYLASPLRREKAYFAVELQRFASRADATVPRVNPGSERRSSSFPSFNLSPIWQGALGATALTAVALVLFLGAENRRLRNEIETERAAISEGGKKIADANQAEIARLNERITQLGSQPVATATPATANASDPGLFTIALAAPIRGMASLRKIEIPRQTQTVEVELELETEGYPTYRVALRDPLTGGITWQSSNLHAVRTRSGAALHVRLPGRLFSAQRYALEVSGITTNNSREPMASYPFEVRRL